VFGRLFKRKDEAVSAAAAALNLRIVEAARRPGLFADFGVPDSLDGRYEMVCLHAHLVLRRLKAEHAATAELAQALFDRMFLELDQGLREAGVGDLGVSRRIKQMATGFYGRIAAYDAGLDAAPEQGGLEEALRRNAYGTVTPTEAGVTGLARLVRQTDASLAVQTLAELMAGRVRFPDPV